MNNEKHGQGTNSTKMGVDKLAENTQNAPKCICPNCLPKPKRFHLASIVRDLQFIAVTIESAFTITFLVVSRTFMTNTAVSPICQYLIQLLFVEKKLQIFRKALVLEGT